MLVLALESATPAPAVALVEDERVVAWRPAEGASPRSEALLPAVDALLREAGTALADLDGFAVGIGPGSFTGLRVGLSTLKGLAFGDLRPVAGVSTLAAVARRADDPRRAAVAALLDARRGEVYAAVWAAGRDPAPCVPEGLYRPETLAARLPAPCLLVGDAAEVSLPVLRAHGAHVRPADCGAVGPCADQVVAEATEKRATPRDARLG